MNTATAILVAAAWLFGGVQQRDSYVIASPNTRESLTDQDARVSLSSFEQLNATAVADRIACSLTRSVEISGALGVYEHSAENSFIVETHLPKAQTEYLASLLGRYNHQQFVLLFMEGENTPDRLWIITVPGQADAVIGAFRRQQLTPLTIREGESQTEAWFVDAGNKSEARLKAIADELHAGVKIKQGSAELLGDDDRAKAAKIFQHRIDVFERRGRSLSANLWRRQWRDATQPTCSVPMPANRAAPGL